MLGMRGVAIIIKCKEWCLNNTCCPSWSTYVAGLRNPCARPQHERCVNILLRTPPDVARSLITYTSMLTAVCADLFVSSCLCVYLCVGGWLCVFDCEWVLAMWVLVCMCLFINLSVDMLVCVYFLCVCYLGMLNAKYFGHLPIKEILITWQICLYDDSQTNDRGRWYLNYSSILPSKWVTWWSPHSAADSPPTFRSIIPLFPTSSAAIWFNSIRFDIWWVVKWKDSIDSDHDENYSIDSDHDENYSIDTDDSDRIP